MTKKKKKKSATRLFIILLIFVVIIGTGAFFLYNNYFNNKEGPEKKLENIEIKKELISFSINMLPDIYTALLDLNEEMGVIKKEIERLNNMEKEYPQQKKIILSEKKIWDKTQKGHFTVLSKLEKEIEAIYVSYMVNPEKGMKRIEDKKTTELLTETNKIITASKTQTERLKVVVELSFIDSLKEKFLKKEQE